MFIRPVDQEDVDKIAAIEEGGPSPWSKVLIESELRCSTGIQIAAFTSTDFEIVGWCCARFIEPEAELLKIATSRYHRRKGIATQLLQELFGLCRKNKCCKLFLEVREQNDAALSLYTTLGFTMHSRRDNYYHSPTDNCLVLIKHIDDSNI